MIPCASPLAQFKAQEHEIRAAVARVLEGGIYILGPEVEHFENAFARYCGLTHAIAVGSGTDAISLAMRALDIGPGDEVITVSHTALASLAAILAVGAIPVLVDIEPAYYTIDPRRIEAAITARTKAILAVHIYGQAVDLDSVRYISKRHSLPIIEDCAQATGAFYGNKMLGAIGDVSCFSFYPTKNLGAIGDGGMVVTDSPTIAERVRRLRQYGWNDDRETDEVGVNSRFDALQAAILGAKLPHLDDANMRRAAIAKRYDDELRGLPLATPLVRQNATHVYHVYVVNCADREGLRRSLAERKVQAGIHYPVPAHLHGGYSKRVRLPVEGLSVTEAMARRVLSLPMFPELTDEEVGHVIAALYAHFTDVESYKLDLGPSR